MNSELIRQAVQEVLDAEPKKQVKPPRTPEQKRIRKEWEQRNRDAINERRRAKRQPAEKLEPPHGTTQRYHSKLYLCRCEPCRMANRLHTKNLRLKASANADLSKLPHGNTNTYAKYGCRCADCLRATREYQAKRRKEKQS